MQVNNLREAYNETSSDYTRESEECFQIHCASSETTGQQKTEGYSTAYSGTALSKEIIIA
jgi:hypothetical protein